MYSGGILTILTFPVWQGLLGPIQSFALGLIFLLPGGVDGLSQMFGTRESTNILRAITGFLLGIGIVLFSEGIWFSLVLYAG